ncbi:hypothetical protein PDESU_04811 [Pontiella desulfatans]|uniref:Uncharacterized protein n=1 Tax=Pontiella desulfatans TaxID=2750659 RepID=A0A6C2U840_PONDE|nr:hypothetical protein [Pontiella desulfatans]VGO16220.1 hypothetical protein PDESU_04811 [Pontiella desulfatans]
MKNRPHMFTGCFLILAIAGCQPDIPDMETPESAAPPLSSPALSIPEVLPDSPPLDSFYRFFGFDPREALDGVITVQEGPDLDMIERNDFFGYTPEELAEQFHHTITLNYDFRGFDPQSVQAPPRPGVHPRVLFGPDELPALREKLKNTVPGQKAMAAIKKELDSNIRKEGSDTTQGYQDLIAGKTDVPIHKNITIAYAAAYEAFRCLVEDDEIAGREVAKAITTIARIDQAVFEESIAEFKAKNPDAERIDFRLTTKHSSHNGILGLMYDWAYGWMDDQQRQTVREAIALASSNMTLQGAQTLRTPRTSGSNWISWTARLVTLCAAIEGEPGYDATSYDHSVNALKWFFALSVLPEGESMEGWGKQFLMAELGYIMARRGEPILALQNVKQSTFRQFWLHALNPWGRSGNEDHYGGPFTFYDSQGGTDNNIQSMSDVLVYKKLYPEDPYIDFIYRNAVGEDYKKFDDRVNLRHHFSTYTGFCMAIFAATFDESKTWDQARDNITLDAPLSYYGSDTGTMITRSGWDNDALYLYSLNRNITGGHRYADRGHFNVYADGRHWGIYQKMRQVREAYWPMNRSVVLVDGLGPSIAPGKSIRFNDQPLATFAAGDYKITYDYSSNYLFPSTDRDSIVALPYSYNDFRLTPSDRPTWSMPIEQRPDWYTSRKPKPIGARPGPTSYWTQRSVPMKKAFRTTGLVRGTHSYILIVDDIQKDDTEREYQWGMTVAEDVEIHQTRSGSSRIAFHADAVLKEKERSVEESRFLLVRMLRADGLQGDPAILDVVSKNPPQKNTIIPKLTFTARATAPNFITLIAAVDAPDEAPTTSWNPDQTELTIEWGSQKDVVVFQPDRSGRRVFTIHRGGSMIGSSD